MNKNTRLVVFVLVLIAGMFLVGCGPIPAGAEIKVNPDGNSAQVEFTGIVNSIAADLWMVEGQALVVSPLTVLDPSIITGDMVKVHATVKLDGTVTADSIALYTPKNPSLPESAHPSDDKATEFVGVVETISPESWVVSGMTFVINLQTEIYGMIIVGDQVKIEALVGPDGTTTAYEIKLAGKSGLHNNGSELEFSGLVESISPDSWAVAGQILVITPQTKIDGTIVVGDMVYVEAFVGTDGITTAHEIKLAEESDPSKTDGSELEFEGLVEAIGPDSWTVGGQIFAITPQTEIKDTILVGDLVKIEALVGTDGTATAHEIKLAGEKGASSGHGSNMEFTGVVESIGPDSWTVDGKILAITLRTRIDDTIIVGDTVDVKANSSLDGTLTAREIELTGSHGSSTHDSESDDHSSNPGSGSSSDHSRDHDSNHGGGSSSEEDGD